MTRIAIENSIRMTAIAIISTALLLAPAVARAQMITFSNQDLLERARGLSAEEIWAGLEDKKFRNQYADGFQVLHPGKTLVGRAFTVQFMPTRPDMDGYLNAQAKAKGINRLNNQVALDMLQPGDVLVVDLFGKAEGGTIVGDNLFYYMMKSAKCAGLVVDGSVRDLEGITDMDMPAYFR